MFDIRSYDFDPEMYIPVFGYPRLLGTMFLLPNVLLRFGPQLRDLRELELVFVNISTELASCIGVCM